MNGNADEPTTYPLISVIVPAYQVRNYLEECLDSILAQTHINLELIVVDDGSTDGSSEICDRYARRDNRVIAIHQPNGGLSKARNAGLRNASGQYVTLIDGDDWVHPRYLEVLLSLLVQTGSDISACSFHRTETRLHDLPIDVRYRKLNDTEAIEALSGGPIYPLMVSSCAKLYRRELFRNIEFPPSRFHEDEFTTHKLFAAASLVALTRAELYGYRHRSDSIMGSGFSFEKRFDHIEALHERSIFLCSKGYRKLCFATYGRLLRLCLATEIKARSLKVPEASDEADRKLAAVLRDLPLRRRMLRFRLAYWIYRTNPAIFEWFLKTSKNTRAVVQRRPGFSFRIRRR